MLLRVSLVTACCFTRLAEIGGSGGTNRAETALRALCIRNIEKLCLEFGGDGGVVSPEVTIDDGGAVNSFSSIIISLHCGAV